MKKTASRIVLLVAFIATIFILISSNDAVAEEIFDVPGKSYDSDTQYNFITSSPVVSMTFGIKTLGTFQISGDVSGYAENQGFPAYGIEDGNLEFSYNYNETLIFKEAEEWHLASDNGKKIGNIELKTSIGQGTLIVQKSIDGKTWFNEGEPINNLFADNSDGVKRFYTTQSSDINRGTFYRIIVAYQTQKKVGSTDIWFVHLKDNYAKRFHVETYTFYASPNSGVIAIHDLASKITGVDIKAEAYESKKQFYLNDSARLEEMSFGKTSIGEMSISGQITKSYTENSIPVFEAARGVLDFVYRYDDYLLEENENGQVLNQYDKQIIDDINIGKNMGKGALIVQKSKDGITWDNTTEPLVDFFKNFSKNYSGGSAIVYTTNQDDIKQGYFYRIIVAYETLIKTRTTGLLGTSMDHKEYPKHVEIYKFYLKLSDDILSTDLFSTKAKEAAYGFEIDKAGTPYDVSVDGKPVDQGERITEKKIHTISVKSIYGKENIRTIEVINGLDEKNSVANNEPLAVDSTELPGPTASLDPSEVPTPTLDPNISIYYLGSTSNTGNDNGYSKSKNRNVNDPHFGWEIGRFFVSGFTSDKKDSDEIGTPVFLKVPGDKIALRFILDQDINCLNGKTNLTIVTDNKGYDEYFGVPKTDFGRGTLIIKHTNRQNSFDKPTIYTNYLAAKAVHNEDTTVELFEEGDYEVALNYKIMQDNSLVDMYESYRIYFKFKVRNGNCMVYPFDVTTKAELTDNAITENGFYLDLAKSRYLDINIKKETLVEGVTGLVEDTRFNRSARDGDQYTDQGIYTITVQNEYTKQITSKKIYVGPSEMIDRYFDNGLEFEEVQGGN